MSDITKSDALFIYRMTAVSEQDRKVLLEKNRDYGESWKKRGGVGAYMMLARKWDRIENLAKDAGFDIFELYRRNPGDVRDDIKDLRRYLILVEQEMMREEHEVEDAQFESTLVKIDPKPFQNAEPPPETAMPVSRFEEVANAGSANEQENMRAYELTRKDRCDFCGRKMMELPMPVADNYCFINYAKCYDCTKKSMFKEDLPALDMKIEEYRRRQEALRATLAEPQDDQSDHAASIRSQGA